MVKILLFLLLSLQLIQSAEKPNIIFVIADDCTFRDIGCYGGQAKTPHINKLATEGMKFELCFQTAPMCSPTRHNIYTGLYPVKSGAYPNHTFVYPRVKSIVHHLKPLGYETFHTGKGHISPREVFPFKRLGKGKEPDMKEIDKMLAASSESGKPFCLLVCSNEPHGPWTKGDASVYPPNKIKLPPYIVDTPEVRSFFSRYLAEVTYFDSQVGKVLKMVDKHKLQDNTLIMVVSEQGNGFPFAKWTCYDHGLQSAMVVRWPGKVKAGSKTNAMVEYVDILPTFIDAAEGKPVSKLDGKSFLKVLKGEKNKHKDFVYGLMTTRGINHGSEAYAIRSIRSDSHKLILNLHHKEKFTNACTNSAFFKSMEKKAAEGDSVAQKLVHAYHYRPAIELYDINNDPLEMNNIAGQKEYEPIIQKLKNKLEAWMKSQGDQGIKTEMRAKERQKGGRKQKKK